MKQQALIRLAVLVVLLLNQTLITLGMNPLPFSEQSIYEGFSAVSATAMALYAWWKNSNVTKEAQSAQRYLNELKGGK